MRELEIQLEEERSQRSQAVSSKKQLEAELQEAEAQVEATSRGKEEAVKQLRRLQVSPKRSDVFYKNFQSACIEVKTFPSATGSNERNAARV